MNVRDFCGSLKVKGVVCHKVTLKLWQWSQGDINDRNRRMISQEDGERFTRLLTENMAKATRLSVLVPPHLYSVIYSRNFVPIKKPADADRRRNHSAIVIETGERVQLAEGLVKEEKVNIISLEDFFKREAVKWNATIYEYPPEIIRKLLAEYWIV